MKESSIPIMQLRPDMLLLYSLQVDRKYRSRIYSTRLGTIGADQGAVTKSEKWRQNKYSGEMTKHAIKRCKKAINTLLAIAEWKTAKNFKSGKEFRFKLNFITLTIPVKQGDISDKTIKKEVLDVFMKAAKRKWKLKSYIWKAERQANGNLHFHLTSDTYIPYDQLRDTWNHCLNRLGMIDEFERKHGHRHPNSTDVHATKGIKHLRNYFVKYFTKGTGTVEKLVAQAPRAQPLMRPRKWSEGVRFKRVLTNEESKIEGKTWDCSTNLKIKDRAELEITMERHERLSELMEQVPDKVKSTEHCTMIFLSDEERRRLIPLEWNVTFDEWRQRIRNYERTEKRKDSSHSNAPPELATFTGQEKEPVLI